MSAQKWLFELQENGYRITRARSAVVETVVTSDHALTPLDVYTIAREKYRALGLVTVYRTLEKLEELHLIQRVHQKTGCQAFVPCGQGHQHLLLCQECGQAVIFDGDNLESLIHKIAGKTGYEITDHWLQLFGRCQNCRLPA